jgi:hypothetical protein
VALSRAENKIDGRQVDFPFAITKALLFRYIRYLFHRAQKYAHLFYINDHYSMFLFVGGASDP